MNKTRAMQLLNAINGKHLQVRDEWVTTSCVFAPWKHRGGVDAHPSAAIKIYEDGESFYNCFGCGAFDLMDLLLELKRLGASLPLYDLATASDIIMVDGEELRFTLKVKKNWGEIEELEPEVTFSEIWLNSFPLATVNPVAMEYLRWRNLPEDVILKLEIRYDYSINAVCFPIRDFRGLLKGLRGRRLNPTEELPRYHIYKTGLGKHNPLVWFGENLLDFDKPIVMVESVFDVASVFRVYENVCAPMNAGVSEAKARRMNAATELVLFFDSDKPGDRARQKVMKYLSKSYIQNVYPTEGAKDPGEMDETQLRDLLKPFVKLKELPQ